MALRASAKMEKWLTGILSSLHHVVERGILLVNKCSFFSHFLIYGLWRNKAQNLSAPKTQAIDYDRHANQCRQTNPHRHHSQIDR